ncbi:MAG: hypothetical protein IMHGJWDQ_000709 [Candidatus Fervidibacter sp.]
MVRTRPKGQSDIRDINDGGRGWSWDGRYGHESLPIPTARLGLWLFLGAVTMMFAAFTSAYLVRLPMPDWRTIPKPPILWLNTILLLVSSGVGQWAWSSIRKDDRSSLRWGLVLTTLLGIAFLLGQMAAWRQLISAGVYLQTNPASSFFYLLTAVHGFHLLGGLIALLWTTYRAWRGDYTRWSHLGVELSIVYWHFLTIVWLWVFALLHLR